MHKAILQLRFGDTNVRKKDWEAALSSFDEAKAQLERIATFNVEQTRKISKIPSVPKLVEAWLDLVERQKNWMLLQMKMNPQIKTSLKIPTVGKDYASIDVSIFD